MSKMMEDWDSINFNLIAYRDSGINILSSVDDIQTTLDDQIVKTQTMRGSPFIKPFEAEIKVWSHAQFLGYQIEHQIEHEFSYKHTKYVFI